MFDIIKNAVNKANEITKDFNIPIPQSMINDHLSKIIEENHDIGEKIKSLQIVIHEGYFDIIAEVQHAGISTNNKLSFTFDEFNCNFGANDNQTIIIKQKDKPEISGTNWFNKAVVGAVRGILEAATKTDLPQLAIGTVDGITVSNDRYIFDLIKLDVKRKLITGTLSYIKQDHPLLKLAMEKAIGLYSIKGATCKDELLTLHLRRND